MSYGPDSLTFNIYLAPVPGEGASFTTVLLIVDLATNPLDGSSRYLEFISSTDVTDAADAGYISSATAQALNDAFSQSPRPNKIIVGYADLVGSETYATALTAIRDAGANFYTVCINSRVDANILLVSAAVETYGRELFILQSDDATWLTSGYPATLTDLESRERSITTYHDTDTEYLDLCWATTRTSFSPDEKSYSWSGIVKEVANYTTALTSAQKGFALANEVNTMLSWGGNNWVSPGLNCNNRPIEHIVSVDWFRTRLDEGLVQLIQLKASRGEKLIIGTVGQTASSGQTAILAVINGLIQQGLAIGHFVEATDSAGDNVPYAKALAVTAADITAQRLRFDVKLLLSTGAQNFTFNIYASAIID